MATVTNKLLWFVLCLSQLIYIAVIFIKEPTPRTSSAVETMFVALLVIAAGIAVGTLAYRRRVLVDPIRAGKLDPSTKEGAARAFTPFILNLVLSQSIAVYGLVLSFLSNDPAYVVGFVLGALALMYLHRPTAPDLVPPPKATGTHRPPPT